VAPPEASREPLAPEGRGTPGGGTGGFPLGVGGAEARGPETLPPLRHSFCIAKT